MVKINEFEEHMKLQQPLLVKDVKNGTTSKGSPYLSLTLSIEIGNFSLDEIATNLIIFSFSFG